jgi:GNAT superfamily N-acetyltransferase
MPCSTCTTDGVSASSEPSIVLNPLPVAIPGAPVTSAAPARRAPAPKNYRRLQITALRAGDTATVRRVFDGLSGRSRYLRFHAGRATLPIRMQRGLADIRPDQHIAHVAVLAGRPVGLVRWIRFENDRRDAELAVEVIDAVQRTGIGRELIRRAARSAVAAGIEHFVGYLSPGNSELRARAIAHGGVVDPDDRSLVRLHVGALLRSLAPPAPQLPRQRRR